MKWIYYFVFFLFISFFISFFCFIQKGIAKEQQIFKPDIYHLHRIKVGVPNASNLEVKEKVEEFVLKEKQSFLQMLKNNTIQNEIVYTLDISYENYSSSYYESYVFFLTVYTGGAHSNTTIWTINYDCEKREFITIDTFLKEDKNFLQKISRSIRGDLLVSPKITNTLMLIEGTKAIKENFENFVICDQKLIFYFEPYQVAPYSSGIIISTYNL